MARLDGMTGAEPQVPQKFRVAFADREAALSEATRRLEQDFSDTAYAEQQRLIAAKKSYNDRLASLAGSD